MTETHIPEVRMEPEDIAPMTREPVAYHLDDTEGVVEEVSPVYVYIWEDEREERRDELCEEINQFRNEYIYATAIVYSEELRDLVPLSGEQLTAYAWALTLGFWDDRVEDSEDAEQLLSEVGERL